MAAFLSPRPPEELVTVYQAADIIAVPSYNESFGLVALEAQASGTPVVAARVGGLPLTVTEWDEWGNPLENPDVYFYMKSYSPYENVEAKDYPAILATVDGDRARGSARSIASFHLYDALADCRDLFDRFGGNPCADHETPAVHISRSG